MLSPRLSECTECSSISELLDIIDCKLTELAKNEYNNIIFSLNLPIQSETFGDLLNYKRILTNKLCNYDYACAFPLSAIASRVKVLTGGLTNCCVRKKAKPSHYIPIVPSTSTTSTTSTTTTLYCTTVGYWYNAIAVDQTPGYYPESMEIDDSCNIYSFSNLPETQFSSYRKFDSAGTLVWEKTNTNLDIDRYPSEMKIGPDGNLYLVYNSGIRKIDTSGTILWEKYWDIVQNIVGINFDKNGNLFASLYGNDYVFLAKLSASTGSVIAEKEFSLNDASYQWTNNAPLVDSDNNILIAVNFSADGFDQSKIFKFTNDLSIIIWTAILNRADFDNKACDLTGFQIDANNNVYGCNYGSSIFKLNSNGTFAWARTLTSCQDYNNEIFALAVSPEGDVFWVGSQIDFEWCGTSNDNSYIVINKFDTNGVYKWSTAIGQPNPPEDFIYIGSWDYSQDAAKIRNGNLMIVGWNEDNYDEYLFKLPLNQVTPGTYGDLDFLDITSYLTSQTITSTILTSLYTVSDSTILNTPVVCTFGESNPETTIINTIIP
jgi:hypothetical protein